MAGLSSVRWVAFDPTAFLSRPEVQALTNAELGALVRLWGALWSRGAVTPGQVKAVANGSTEGVMRMLSETEGGLTDAWMAELIEASRAAMSEESRTSDAFRELQRARGRKSAAARKLRFGTAQPSSPASNHGSEPGSNQDRTTLERGSNQTDPGSTLVRENPEPLQDKRVQEKERIDSEPSGSGDLDWSSPGISSDARARKPRAQASGPAAEVTRYFEAAYLASYHAPYVFVGGKDGAAIKHLLAYGAKVSPADPLGEVKRRIDRAFEDQFLVTTRKVTLAVVVGEWNRLNGASAGGRAGWQRRDGTGSLEIAAKLIAEEESRNAV